MDTSIIARALLMWFLFLPIPIINGLLREFWYKKHVGENTAHQIGSLVIGSIFLIYTYFFLGDYVIVLSTGALLSIGLFWVGLTIMFECALGLKNGLSWKEMLADYNLCRGRVWPLVLLVIFVAPLFIKMIK